MRGFAAVLITLLLAGCMTDTQVAETPAMYVSMTDPGAKLDPVAAASLLARLVLLGVGLLDIERSQRLLGLQGRLDEAVLAGDDSLKVARVAELIAEQGRALLGASAGTLRLLDERGAALRVVYSKIIAPRSVVRAGGGQPSSRP